MLQRVKLTSSAFDKAFNKEASQYLGLSIQLSLNGFSFCVLDPSQMKYLGLEAFELNNIANYQDLSQLIPEIVRSSDLLGLTYESIKIIIETHKSTLIPHPFFDLASSAENLTLLYSPAKGDIPADDYLPLLEARNVWFVNDELRKTIAGFFPLASVHHHGSVLIESLLASSKNTDPGNGVYVYVRKTWFDIVILEDDQLLFYNSFRYNAGEDFIYFLIYVLEQLDLDPESIKLRFLGEVLRISEIYDITRKYVRNVSFGGRPSGFQYSYVFDQIPGHVYFNLLNHYHCEL